MIGGIPQAGMLIIFLGVLIFILGCKLYWTAVPIALLYFVMRHFTKKDPWFIDMGLDYLMQKDKLIP